MDSKGNIQSTPDMWDLAIELATWENLQLELCVVTALVLYMVWFFYQRRLSADKAKAW